MASREIAFLMSAKDNATRVFGNATSAMGTMGGQTTVLNKKLLALGGASVVAGALMLKSFGGMVSAAADFEYKMAEVWTLMDDVGEQGIAELSDKLLDLSTRVPQSIDSLAEGLYQVSSAGYAGAEGMMVLEQAAKLATAGATTTDVAADAMVRTLNAYNMTAEESERVSDVLFSTVKIGITRMEELGPAWGMVASLAASAGVTVEELGAAFATLTKQGLQTRIAGTAIRGMMTQLLGPSDKLTAVWGTLSDTTIQTTLAQEGLTGVMDKLQGHFQIQTEELRGVAEAAGDDEEAFLAMAEAKGLVTTEMREMFPNVRALIGFLGLMAGGGETWNASLDEISNSTGATEKAYEKMMGTFKNKWEIVKNIFNALKITIGTQVLPAFSWLADKLKVVGEWFNKMSPTVKKFIGIFLGVGGITLVLGGLLAILLAIKGAIIGALVTAAPYIAAAIVVVAALAAAVYLIQKNWEKIKPVIESVWAAVKPVLESIWNKTKEIAKIVVDWLIAAWEKAYPIIVKALEIIWSALTDVWNVIKSVWDSVSGTLIDIFEQFWSVGQEVYKLLQELWPVLKIIGIIIGGAIYIAFKIFVVVLKVAGWIIGHILLPAFKALWWVIKQVIKVVRIIVTVFVEVFKAVWNVVKKVIDDIWDVLVWLGNMFKDIWHGIVETFRSAWNFIVGIWDAIGGPLIEAMKIAWEMVKVVWGAIWDVITALLEVAWDAIKVAFHVIFDPLIAIAKVIWWVVEKTWTNTWNIIKGLLELTWNIIKAVWDSIIPPLVRVAKIIWEAVKVAWNIVWTIIKAALSSVWNGMVAVYNSVIQPLVDAALVVWDAVQVAWDVVWGIIRSGIESVWGVFTTLYNSILLPIVDAVGGVWSGIKGLWTGVWNGIVSAVKGIVNGFVKGINIVLKGVRAASWFVPGVEGPSDIPEWKHSGGSIFQDALYRLQAGEFVIRKAIVEKLGVPFLSALNAMGLTGGGGGATITPEMLLAGAGGGGTANTFGDVNLNFSYPGVTSIDKEQLTEAINGAVNILFKTVATKADNRSRTTIEES